MGVPRLPALIRGLTFNLGLAHARARAITVLVLIMFSLTVGSPCYSAQQAISADEAAAIAKKHTGGRVLGVSSGDEEEKKVYLVRILLPDSGRVIVVAVDSDSGAIK